MKAFLTTRGPKAIGPYSTAMIHGGLAYLSGMLPIDPVTGTLVADDVQAAARQALQNIAAVLEEMGSGMDRCIKVTVYMRDMDDFAAVNTIYQQYFGPDYPARSAVQVARLPMDAPLEIEVIAALDAE